MQDELFVTEEVLEKCNNIQVSGYLDEEYEKPKNYPQLEEYHFRIEDERVILELQNLMKNSSVIPTGISVPKEASQKYTEKLDNLVASLDEIMPTNQTPKMEAEKHGFYKMHDDSYNEDEAMKAAQDCLNILNLNKKMEEMKISEKQIKFKKREKAKKKVDKESLEVIKKMRNLSIDQEQL